ncbi:ArsR/SmtB family transcription factor [Sagittula sp. S175]|uniref:ArsR/SmtB family transcription factor n=1 Tax=Sagittula sp. S175 TaxID=3415129 RepID=UPI003C7980E8
MANQLDTFFGAIADPTRRAVIERLVTGPASVSELAEPHDMALPSFLKHLNKLEQAGLIRTIKTGRTRTAYIEPAPLAQAEHWLARQRKLWEGRLDRLALLAEQLEREDKK